MCARGIGICDGRTTYCQQEPESHDGCLSEDRVPGAGGGPRLAALRCPRSRVQGPARDVAAGPEPERTRGTAGAGQVLSPGGAGPLSRRSSALTWAAEV